MENNIKALRLLRGMSLADVARAASTTPAQVQKLERGERRLTDQWLSRLSVVLECRASDLLRDDVDHRRLSESFSGTDFEHSSVRHLSVRYVDLPFYEDPARHDGAAMLDDAAFVSKRIPFEAALLAECTSATVIQLAMIRVHGNTMNPTLHEGDVVLIDRSRSTAQDDGIYALNHNGRIMIKRLQFHPVQDKVSVLSDNKDYPAHEIGGVSELSIIGKIIWAGKRF